VYTVTLIPGDGIGPEVTDAMRRCVEALGVPISWEVVQAGAKAMERYGTPLPEHVLDSVRRNRVAIKGPITTPVGGGFRSVNVALRQALDLYACLRPCKYYPGVRSPYRNVDLVIVRENTEDLYAGIEFAPQEPATGELLDFIAAHTGQRLRPGSAISIKAISEYASARIVRFAFQYALTHQRRKVTIVHKANIMKYSDGLFLEVAQQVAQEFASSGIEWEDRIVDNMAMQLVQKPELYDVLVMPNLYGDILSDLAAGLVGGLGVVAGANLGDEYAVFEPVHGSAPKYAGLNKVNPTATILAAVLMLHYLGEHAAARRLERAVADVIRAGEHVTYDLKPQPDDPTAVGTREMTDAIIAALEAAE
jgi:isocitrate dehydrogenase (NAD+)